MVAASGRKTMIAFSLRTLTKDELMINGENTGQPYFGLVGRRASTDDRGMHFGREIKVESKTEFGLK